MSALAGLEATSCADCGQECHVLPEELGPRSVVRCGRCSGTPTAVVLWPRGGAVAAAADLLAAGHCSARCLLAMESPPGPGPWCSCTCRGRFHAALIDVTVQAFGRPW